MSIIEFRSSLIVLHLYDTIYEILDTKGDTKNLTKRYTNINRNFQICKEADAQFQEFQKNLQPKYNLLGSASLNSYKLLKQNEDLMEKQRSQIFINSTTLYSNSMSNNNLNKSDNAVHNEMKDSIKLKIFDNVHQNFQSEIFLTGIKIGTIEGNISIKNIPLLRQILCGVHTEKGLDLNAAYLGLIEVDILDKDKDHPLPEDLIQLTKDSKLLFLKISGNSTSLTKVSAEYRQNNEEINSILNKTIENLKHSEKESILFYNYVSSTDIIKGQQTMIDLGVKILSVVESLNNDHRLKALTILSLIMDRGELDLEMMSKIIADKLENNNEICLNLIAFQIRLLDYSLTKLGRKSTDENTKNFIETCIAYCYFRMPLVS